MGTACPQLIQRNVWLHHRLSDLRQCLNAACHPMLLAQRLALHHLHEAAQHIAVVAETEARLLQQLVVEIGRRVVGIDSKMFIAGGEHIPLT
jgi:hypothetical protein